jgi:hypothetical protein
MNRTDKRSSGPKSKTENKKPKGKSKKEKRKGHAIENRIIDAGNYPYRFRNKIMNKRTTTIDWVERARKSFQLRKNEKESRIGCGILSET